MFSFFTELQQQFFKTIEQTCSNIGIAFFKQTPNVDLINYFNLLNQLQAVLFYKQFHLEFARQFGVDPNVCHYNDLFLKPYTDFAIQYYQEKLTTSLNNIINRSCPFWSWYDFRG